MSGGEEGLHLLKKKAQSSNYSLVLVKVKIVRSGLVKCTPSLQFAVVETLK